MEHFINLAEAERAAALERLKAESIKAIEAMKPGDQLLLVKIDADYASNPTIVGDGITAAIAGNPAEFGYALGQYLPPLHGNAFSAFTISLLVSFMKGISKYQRRVGFRALEMDVSSIIEESKVIASAQVARKRYGSAYVADPNHKAEA